MEEMRFRAVMGWFFAATFISIHVYAAIMAHNWYGMAIAVCLDLAALSQIIEAVRAKASASPESDP
jgi:hypothetical protein